MTTLSCLVALVHKLNSVTSPSKPRLQPPNFGCRLSLGRVLSRDISKSFRKMRRLVYCWLLTSALMSLVDSSNREGNHLRHKRTRRDVNFLQDKLIQIRHPQPIHDTATPEELRTPNTKRHNIGIAAVNAYDGVTGVLVNALEFPKRSKNQIGKSLTAFLDQIGGRLVGLQR